MRAFDDEANVPARAVQIWQILIGAAVRRQTVTYGQLAKIMGFGGAGVFGQMLYAIHLYCDANDLPYLNAIVVNKATGEPGGEYPAPRASIPRTHARVWEYPWHAYYVPSQADLRASWESR